METIIGRTKEIGQMTKCLRSGKAEFIALYGRRKVGKTFLVTSYFKNRFDFDVTGIIGGRKDEELSAFHTALQHYGYQGKSPRR
ncbi:MAG: ATP-binding protein [Bacteroidales bacterium]|nr:ATP-binding protein [Bacteroidales bacterium]